MTSHSQSPARPWFLGIEGGGTRTIALLADSQKRPFHRFEAGPGTLKLLTDSQWTICFVPLLTKRRCCPDALGIGLAGARSGTGPRERIREAAGQNPARHLPSRHQ